MSDNMPEVEAYAAGLLEELEYHLEAGHSVRMTGRRIAALAELHALLDPWHSCRCQYCAFHVRHAGVFEENL